MTLRISTGLRDAVLGKSTNLATNGTFDTATTSWTAATATLTYISGAIDGRSNTMSVGTAAGYGHQVITTIPGHIYKVSFMYDAVSGQTGSVTIGTAAGGAQLYDSGLLSSTGAWYTQYAVFTATSTTSYINLKCTGTAAPCIYYDTVTCYDISTCVRDIFNLGSLKIYSGSQPATADTAPTGTLLCTITNASTATGLTFDDSSSASLSKKTGETWSGVCAATGTAGWARLVTGTDGAADSTTEQRIDFAVATVGGQINFSSTSFVSGATQTISTFALSLPVS